MAKITAVKSFIVQTPVLFVRRYSNRRKAQLHEVMFHKALQQWTVIASNDRFIVKLFFCGLCLLPRITKRLQTRG
jgi:hypothetical protein